MENVEKLTLTLSANDVQKFIKDMVNVENELQTVRKGMQEVAKEHGILNRELNKGTTNTASDKKEKKQNTDKERTEKRINKEREKSWKKVSQTMQKFSIPTGGGLGIAGLGLAVAGLTTAIINKSDEILARDSAYVAQTRASGLSVHEAQLANNLEALSNIPAGGLGPLMESLARNRTSLNTYGANDPQYSDFISQLNGFLPSGLGIDQRESDPQKILLSINKALLSLDKDLRDKLLQDVVTPFYGATASSALNDPGFSSSLIKADRNAQITEQQAQQNFKIQQQITEQQQVWQNAFNNLSPEINKLNLELVKLRNDALIPLVTWALGIVNHAVEPAKNTVSEVDNAAKVAQNWFNFSDLPADKQTQYKQQEQLLQSGGVGLLSFVIAGLHESFKAMVDGDGVDLTNLSEKIAIAQAQKEQAQKGFIDSYNERIKNVTTESITFNDGLELNYGNTEGRLNSLTIPTYFRDYYQDYVKKYGSQSGGDSTSTDNSQVYNIDTVNVNTNQATVEGLAQDISSQAETTIVSGSQAINYLTSFN